MVYNDISKLKEQKKINPKYLNAVIEFMKDIQKNPQIDDGRYSILGVDVYANIESYQTKAIEHTRYESHRKFIDIQYMIHGKEQIAVTDVSELSIEEPYNENKDIAFYKDSLAGRKYTIMDGEFLVILPEEAHRPCIAVSEACMFVKKMVIKIRCE